MKYDIQLYYFVPPYLQQNVNSMQEYVRDLIRLLL